MKRLNLKFNKKTNRSLYLRVFSDNPQIRIISRTDIENIEDQLIIKKK